MQPSGTVWTTLVEEHLGIIPVMFNQTPMSGFRGDVLSKKVCARRMMDKGRSQYLTLSTLCSGELKTISFYRIISCYYVMNHFLLLTGVEVIKTWVYCIFYLKVEAIFLARICHGHLTLLRPRKIDFLFLRHLFAKTNARGRKQFLCQIFFSCFPINSNVKHCVISYILPLITKIFSRTVRCNTVLMFYNITRAVTIALML